MRAPFRGLCLLSLALLARAAAAQAPMGPEFRVNTSTTGVHGTSALSVDPAGNFVVVWVAVDGTLSVMGQRFDATGAPRGAAFTVANAGTAAIVSPGVATDANGAFTTVWDERLPGTSDVRGRRYDANGSPAGPPFVVHSATTGYQTYPAIAAHSGGSFVVVWADDFLEGSGFGIVGQRFDSAGNRLGSEFIVNSYTTGDQWRLPSVAMDAAGDFVVVWSGPRPGQAATGIFGQRFSATGFRIGAEFQVDAGTTSSFGFPRLAMEPGGRFVVVWQQVDGDGDGHGLRPIHARRFDAAGAPVGAQFVVAPAGFGSEVTMDAAGRFVVVWCDYEDGSQRGLRGRWYEADATPRGRAVRVNTSTARDQIVVSLDSAPAGEVVVTWSSDHEAAFDYNVYAQRHGLLRPRALRLDTAAGGPSNGNGVLEAGETVDVRPSWENGGSVTQDLIGALTSIGGPPGASYTIDDGDGLYGAVPSAVTRECQDCYRVSVSAPPTRPALHWDATLTEVINPGDDGHLGWALHVGDSFSDVPRASEFYRFVEAMLHHGVTSGCGGGAFCPSSFTTREQVAPFLLIAKEGATYLPRPCGLQPVFADVPVSSPFCRWIEELARRGVTGGCGGGNYCPAAPVSREQMAVFVLRTLDPNLNPPACTTPIFNDVPTSSPFCRWVEELARRGIVTGCGGGNYCPTAAVTREQMAVFLTGTFGLTLYGP